MKGGWGLRSKEEGGRARWPGRGEGCTTATACLVAVPAFDLTGVALRMAWRSQGPRHKMQGRWGGGVVYRAEPWQDLEAR